MSRRAFDIPMDFPHDEGAVEDAPAAPGEIVDRTPPIGTTLPASAYTVKTWEAPAVLQPLVRAAARRQDAADEDERFRASIRLIAVVVGYVLLLTAAGLAAALLVQFMGDGFYTLGQHIRHQK